MPASSPAACATPAAACATLLDVAGRLARALLDLTQQPDAKSSSKGILVKVSRQELARIVGCSREMAGRVLKKLEEDGLVSTSGRSITVTAAGNLAEYKGQD